MCLGGRFPSSETNKVLRKSETILHMSNHGIHRFVSTVTSSSQEHVDIKMREMSEWDVIQVLYMKMSCACVSKECHWRLLSVVPPGTLSFSITKDEKCIRVELRSDESGVLHADLGFNRASLRLASEEFEESILRSLDEKGR